MSIVAPNSFYDIFTLVLCFSTTALALAFGHYFPWRDLLGRELPRIWAYVYGTVWVYAPIAILFLLEGQARVVYIIAAAIFMAGLSDLLCYAFDAWRGDHREKRAAQAAAQDAAQREAELRKSLEGPGD